MSMVRALIFVIDGPRWYRWRSLWRMVNDGPHCSCWQAVAEASGEVVQISAAASSEMGIQKTCAATPVCGL